MDALNANANKRDAKGKPLKAMPLAPSRTGGAPCRVQRAQHNCSLWCQCAIWCWCRLWRKWQQLMAWRMRLTILQQLPAGRRQWPAPRSTIRCALLQVSNVNTSICTSTALCTPANTVCAQCCLNVVSDPRCVRSIMLLKQNDCRQCLAACTSCCGNRTTWIARCRSLPHHPGLLQEATPSLETLPAAAAAGMATPAAMPAHATANPSPLMHVQQQLQSRNHVVQTAGHCSRATMHLT